MSKQKEASSILSQCSRLGNYCCVLKEVILRQQKGPRYHLTIMGRFNWLNTDSHMWKLVKTEFERVNQILIIIIFIQSST